MSGLYQAAKGYVRCLRWLARFNLAALCLASAFVFSGAIGAMAQVVADAGPKQTVASGAEVMLDGTGSTAGSGRTIRSYAWERTDGTGGSVKLSDKSVAKPTFTADTLVPGAADVTHVFTLTVTDDGDETDTDTVTVTVTSPFLPTVVNTVVNTGSDRTVASGVTVTLDGSGSTSDPRRPIVQWIWHAHSWPIGSRVIEFPQDFSTPTFSFVAESLPDGVSSGTYEFQLGVFYYADGTRSSEAQSASSERIRVTVIPSAPPTADAGADPDAVAPEATVTLDGTGSTAVSGRTIRSYAWERTSGTTGASVTLSDASVAKPTFTADTPKAGSADVTHVFTLTVTDNRGETDTDTVTVTVTAPFAPTVANPGPDRTVASGTTVTLDGTGSTIDRRRSISGWEWRQTGGTGRARLLFGNLSQNTPILVFTADTLAPGAESVTHDLILRVGYYDGGNYHIVESNVVTVTIIPNEFVYAVAGDDQTVASGEVTLDGTGSLAVSGRSIASYAWERTSGTGGSVKLSDKSVAKPTFTPDTPEAGSADVTHVFTLTVTDNRGETDTDTVTVTVTAPFAPTVANPGSDRTVASGTTVRLDGSSSTSDRRRPITGWEWRQTGGTGRKKLLVGNVSQITPMLVFTADKLAPGAESVTHELVLRVGYSDGRNYHIVESNVVTVTIIPPTPPDAVAGDDQMVASGATVTLDGTGSTAVSGRSIASYAWKRTSGIGPSVTLSNASVANPYFYDR